MKVKPLNGILIGSTTITLKHHAAKYYPTDRFMEFTRSDRSEMHGFYESQ